MIIIPSLNISWLGMVLGTAYESDMYFSDSAHWQEGAEMRQSEVSEHTFDKLRYIKKSRALLYLGCKMPKVLIDFPQICNPEKSKRRKDPGYPS